MLKTGAMHHCMYLRSNRTSVGPLISRTPFSSAADTHASVNFLAVEMTTKPAPGYVLAIDGFVKQYVRAHLMLRTEAASNNVNGLRRE